MEKKKILIVSRSFYPQISPRSFRSTELAKEFSRQGHRVTVLTDVKNYDYSHFLKEYPVELKSFGELRFRRIGGSRKAADYFKHKLGRLLFMLFNYPDIELMWRLKKALGNESGYDLMISIAVPYPVHWGTAWARTKKNPISKIWIADCGDPYMGNTLESFRIPFYFSFLEKWFSRKANYISIPEESAIEGYYREFHPKIRIVPQGFRLEKIRIAKKASREWPVFAYAGGIAYSGVRCPLKLIDYLLTVELPFEFHIYSSSESGFLSHLILQSKGRILVHPAVPREELMPILGQMDFLVNLDNGTTRQIPSKLIDYALTGRPILNINPVNPDTEVIDQFLKGDYRNAHEVLNIEKYDIENVVAKFYELMES